MSHLTTLEPRHSAAPTPPTAPDALPSAPLTSFVGREREMAALQALLASTRLLTLTGAGGSGKTRLAFELAAREAAALPGAVVWVELAPFHDEAALPSHVATALGIRVERGEDVDEMLATAFRDRALLLVLDNCEHLVEACARFVERHLRGARGLRILATSREALGVAGERAWLVPALSLPAAEASDAEGLASSEAVHLFVQRARDVVATFALTDANAAAVARICRQLDGLPLAIELAAARVRALTPSQIADRLGQAFGILTTGGRTAIPRHRTLREAIQWSYDLLAPREQLLLQRLSVFAGGFTLEAAETVCAGDPVAGDEVLDLVATLVDKSLVATEGGEQEPRYRLLETVRQFAAERFAAGADADAVRARHAAFHVAMIEEADPHLFVVVTEAAWLVRVDAEVGNLLAAAEWLETREDGADLQLRLAAALDWYTYARGRFELVTRLLRRALERRSAASPRNVTRALTALAHHGAWTSDFATAREAGEEAVAMARALGDPGLLAHALAALGAAAAFGGDSARAIPVLEESSAIALEVDPPLRTFAMAVHVFAAMQSGDMATAVAMGQELLDLLRDQGRFGASAEMHAGIGRAMLGQGDAEGAMRLFADAVPLAHEDGRIWAVVHNLESMMTALAQHGDPARATRLLGLAQALRDRYGMRLRPFRELDDRAIARLRETLGAAAYARLLLEGRAMRVEDAAAYAAASVPVTPGADAATRPAPRPSRQVVALPDDASSRPAAPALRVHALGPVEMWRDGAPLPPSDWKYAKPRELLLYLLAHPEGRTREQIGLAFWPDATAAQVKNSFHVLLHHLRRTLGRAELVAFDGERYHVAWQLGVVFDAAQFERDARAAMRALREARDDTSATAAASALRVAIATYRGELLADESAGDWHLEPRERLARLYVDALRALADRQERAGEWAEAAATYRRLVQADTLNEDAYRRLMRTLARAGERTQAMKAYDRLAALLRADLEAEPEPETTALHERLRRAEAV